MDDRADWVSDGLGAIYPPMMYAIMALDLLGYAPDHPLRSEAESQFERLIVDDGREIFLPAVFLAWFGTRRSPPLR